MNTPSNNEDTKLSNDFILLILNCEKYKYKAEKQKETWLKYLPDNLLYFHVIGKKIENINENNSENEYEIDDENKVLYVNTKDDYNSLPDKVITAYKIINKLYNFKYIFKTDDDQMLKNNNFFATIIKQLINKETQKMKSHYGGFIIDVKQDYYSKYYMIHEELPKNLVVKRTKYCSGRFYFLSEEAIKDLIENEEEIKKEYLEDYAIGYNLSDEYKNNMINIKSDFYFEDLVEEKLATWLRL
jgi:hypothetical protein